MLDFVTIKAMSFKKNTVDIYPEFLVKKSKDLMVRGKSFYAVWDEETGLWSRSEGDVQRIVDNMVQEYANKYQTDAFKIPKLMSNFSSKKWTEWQQYCKSLPDNYHELDENITFSNTEIKKTDYVSRRLPYPMEKGKFSAYDELIGTLYDPEEREKLEWAIGAVISGDSKKIQKFIVLYGGPGTGKSTVLNIIQDLFPGYYSVFESKALASANNVFALEAFRTNPLVAIQHDGDLSRIEDNTKLNSIVSHEMMVVNEKFKATYSSRFNSFIFMGTNKPVKITDAKSGIIRRLIDVIPSGNRIPSQRFDELISQIQFELGAIAYHCLEVYNNLGPNYYDGYLPLSMMGATNDFYNFVEDNYDFFVIDHPDGVSLNMAWIRYKEYCVEANVPYPYSKRIFKDELKNYFKEFHERYKAERNFYKEFLKEKMEYKSINQSKKDLEQGEESQSDIFSEEDTWLKFDNKKSTFDMIFSECPAQYASNNGIPTQEWKKVSTVLNDIDPTKLHYVKVPRNLIVIDFDIKDADGNKDYKANLKAASKWPPTYAELSKSEAGIHLHYFYDGDVSRLSRIFDQDIEVKVSTGNSSLRRLLTRCNDIPVATISSGLPLKGEKVVIKDEQIKSERALRDLIKRNLRKEIHGNTKPSMDFIYKILEDSYNSGLKYDVTDLRPAVQRFALGSTHQADYCMKLLSKMHFQSDESSSNVDAYKENAPIIFFDVEVFPNLFILNWKKQGEGCKVVRMINPSPSDVEELTRFKLVGFNNRKYDNHILYARMMGYTEFQLFKLSQRIISGERNAMFGEAYNLSYTDIYDFLSAPNRMSLKKWEIKLGIYHQELDLPWDQPVPEELWKKVADYCENDVIATEAVWNANQADWLARGILAELSGLTANDTTNQHTTKIIVGDDKNPQSQYIYTDLSTIFPGYRFNAFGIPKEDYIPGTKIVSGKSIYRGEDPGEGGYVYAEPGMYRNVALLDVESMHPHSAITLKIFGETYTERFKDIVQARLAIKHKDYEFAKTMLDGKLAKYLDDPAKAKKLSNALKTAINSVYGLTSARFDNKLRDPRNVDNIVAKYGALFMINLKHEVQKRGFTVVHIKTDSIKIADATPDIIDFVMNYGKEYGYKFEHEATYKKMCLVNDAVYIAQYEEPYKDEKTGRDIWWTATGTQFQVPYVFKTLFSKEPIEFDDLCETKSVSTALYLDMNDGTDDYHFVGKVGKFCPIKPGCGGGVLLRENNGKYHAATGTKKSGKVSKDEPDIYFWLESEVVKLLNKEKDIDRSYYNAMVDAAVETISQYGDFERFASSDISEDLSWLATSKKVS